MSVYTVRLETIGGYSKVYGKLIMRLGFMSAILLDIYIILGMHLAVNTKMFSRAYLSFRKIFGRYLLGNHMARAHIRTQRMASSSSI